MATSLDKDSDIACSTPEDDCFELLQSTITSSSLLINLSHRLYSNRCIDEGVLDVIESDTPTITLHVKTKALIEAMKVSVSRSHDKLFKQAMILKKFKETCLIGSSIIGGPSQTDASLHGKRKRNRIGSSSSSKYSKIDDETLQQSAREAMKNHIVALNQALSASPDNNFIYIVLACYEHGLITTVNVYLDTSSPKNIHQKAADLNSYLQTAIVIKPECHLDAFLCILLEHGGIPGDTVAQNIANDYGHELVKYKEKVAERQVESTTCNSSSDDSDFEDSEEMELPMSNEAIATDTLLTHYSTLSQLLKNSINIARLRLLYEENVISEEAYSKVAELTQQSPEDKVAIILSSVRQAVKKDYRHLKRFAECLLRIIPGKETFKLVKPIFHDFDKAVFNNKVAKDIAKTVLSENQPTTSRSMSPKEVIHIPPNMEIRFKEIRMKFHTMLYNVSRVIECSGIDIEELKKFALSICPYSHLESSISECTTINQVLEEIKTLCSLNFFLYFESIVEQFQIEEAKKYINSYKIDFEDFCDRTAIRLFLGERFALKESSLEGETATFVFNWDPDDYTLTDVRCVLLCAFEKLTVTINVDVIKEGNSVIITCSFPLEMAGLLIAEAMKNLKILIKKHELLSLRIGYCVVWDVRDEEELKGAKLEVKSAYEKSTSEKAKLQEQSMIESSEEFVKQKESESKLVGPSDQTDEKQPLKENEKFLHTKILTLGMPILDELSIIKEQVTVDLKQDIESKMTLLKDQLEENKKEIVKLTNDIKEMEIVKLTTEQERVNDCNEIKIKKLKNELEEAKKKYSELEQEKIELEQKLDKLSSRLETEKIKSKKQILEIDTMRREKAKVEENNQEIQEEIMNLRVPTVHFDWLQQESDIVPVNITMMNFDQFRRNKESWFSPSFLSGPYGYKMCLRINPHGEGKGLGTHMSLHVHLMATDWADQLQWPFKGLVEIELINRREDSNHHTKIIHFDATRYNKEACQCVINGKRTKAGLVNREGEGEIEFIKLEDLQHNNFKRTEYLKDDSIRICVRKVIVDVVQMQPNLPEPDDEWIAEFKIENFSSQKKANAECISQPFYSHKGNRGYKFVLFAYPNGRDSRETHVKGQSVSAYIHLMGGEHDNSGLSFPFRGEFIVQIVNVKNNKNHVEHKIEFSDKSDPDGQCGGKVSGLLAWFASYRSFRGLGVPDFLRHEYLEHDQAQYIKDDSLTFRICKIIVNSRVVI